jgi:DNA (cytosine-5)-methyltransferase 1
MVHGSLFSGIGGFDLASEWMGWENKFHCEWNEFGQKVLKYYWPKAESFTDITKTDFTKYAGKIDILTGGFPCQPYSTAGKRKGKEDERHLWPEMLRAIREIQPGWVVGENVLGLVNWNGGLVFDEVQADLEAQGYEVFPYVLPACAKNAPHRRDRVWFIAYSDGASKRNNLRTNGGKTEEIRWQDKGDVLTELSSVGVTTDTNSTSVEGELQRSKGEGEFNRCIGGINTPTGWKTFPTQSPICNGDDGVSSRLDSITFPKWRSESIKAGGNAIVPQVAYEIFKTIENYATN